MEGLVEKKTNNLIYLDIKYQGLCQAVKTQEPGFKSYPVLNPQTGQEIIKYVKFYDSVEGMVTSIEFRDTHKEYDNRYMDWIVMMNAAGTPVRITFPFKGRMGSRLMSVAENIDFSKPLKISAWKGADGLAVAFYQNGQNVPSKYTKEDRGDMPEPTFSDLDGWNFSEVNKFLYDQMINVVIPKVDAQGNRMPEQPDGLRESGADEVTKGAPNDDDEIPF